MDPDTDGGGSNPDQGGTGDTGSDEDNDGLWDWLSGIADTLGSVWQAITDLPSLILEGIKAIFIPDAQAIEEKFLAFVQEIQMKANFDTEFFENLIQGESVVQDVYADYDIPYLGEFRLKVFDSKFFVDGVTYFRPFIRGFLVLLMAFYNIKMLLGWFRQDAGIVTGKAVSHALKEDKGK